MAYRFKLNERQLVVYYPYVNTPPPELWIFRSFLGVVCKYAPLSPKHDFRKSPCWVAFLSPGRLRRVAIGLKTGAFHVFRKTKPLHSR